jgi:hypothetical protein
MGDSKRGRGADIKQYRERFYFFSSLVFVLSYREDMVVMIVYLAKLESRKSSSWLLFFGRHERNKFSEW